MSLKSIILVDYCGVKELWGSLKGFCDEHDWASYYTLRNKEFPFRYKGVDFDKVLYKCKIIKK